MIVLTISFVRLRFSYTSFYFLLPPHVLHHTCEQNCGVVSDPLIHSPLPADREARTPF